MDAFEYDAFISYSHRDLKWAKWIQEKLETFHIPDGADELFTNRRRMRVFRDQTDLAGVEVTTSLRRELRLSRFLIVVCSPNSAASRWVNDEVAYFEGLGRQDNIIAFIVDGEPDSDNPALECYPPRMRSTGERSMLGALVGGIRVTGGAALAERRDFPPEQGAVPGCLWSRHRGLCPEGGPLPGGL